MINKKDSGATVLHLPLSEKTKPVDGLMTDYCSNIQFFSTTEQVSKQIDQVQLFGKKMFIIY